MARVIILEGPDGSGKTTLAGRFIADGYTYSHCGVPAPGEDLLQLYAGQLIRAAESQRPTVIDRFYLGESVYGPVMRGHDALGLDKQDLMRSLCRCLGAIQVVCLPRWELVLGNWRQKTGDYVTGAEKLKQIYDLYAEHLRTKPELIRFDYETGFTKGNIQCPIAAFI